MPRSSSKGPREALGPKARSTGGRGHWDRLERGEGEMEERLSHRSWGSNTFYSGGSERAAERGQGRAPSIPQAGPKPPPGGNLGPGKGVAGDVEVTLRWAAGRQDPFLCALPLGAPTVLSASQPSSTAAPAGTLRARGGGYNWGWRVGGGRNQFRQVPWLLGQSPLSSGLSEESGIHDRSSQAN